MEEAGVKTFAIGDIHGAHKALLQCFERSGFDRENDRLIVLGDVCDGYTEVRQCIDELLKVRHCELVIGNHDLWALDWAIKGLTPEIWTGQGGTQTLASYGGGPMPQAHVDFLKSGKPWIELDGMFFVHGGYNPMGKLEKQTLEFVTWDRTLLTTAWKRRFSKPERKFGPYEAIFVGHTTTELYHTLEPLHVCNVWDLDTGAGWSGKLTIMNVYSKEYWQADLTQELYGGTPDHLSRE
jgi:serine/threonine protein phosphatase 1